MDFTNTQGTWKLIKEYIDSKLSGGDDNLPVGTLLTTYNNKNILGDKWKLADGSLLKEYNELYDTTKLYPNNSLITYSAEELFNSGDLSVNLAYNSSSAYNSSIKVLAQKKIGEYIYFVTENLHDDNEYHYSVRVIRFDINKHTIEYLYNLEYRTDYNYQYSATINNYGIVIEYHYETFVKYTYCFGFDNFTFKSVTLYTDSDEPFSDILAFCISDEKVFFFQYEGTDRRTGFILSGSYTFKDITKDTTGGTYDTKWYGYYEYNGDIFILTYEGYMKLNPDTFVVEYSNKQSVASFVQNLDDPNSMYYLISGTLYKALEFPTGTIVATNTSLGTYSGSFLNFQGYNLAFKYGLSAVLSDLYVYISNTLMPNTNVIYAYLEDANTIIYICLLYGTSSFVITKYKVTYDSSWTSLPTISNTFIKIKS